MRNWVLVKPLLSLLNSLFDSEAHGAGFCAGGDREKGGCESGGEKEGGGGFLLCEVEDGGALAVGFEDFFHKVDVQGMDLVGFLGGFVGKQQMKGDLVALIDDIAVARNHAADMKALREGDRAEVFLGTGDKGVGGVGDFGPGPEDDDV